MSETSINVIDLKAWTKQDNHLTTPEARQDVVDAVGEACRDIGFFAIRNHGVNASVMKEAWTASQEFFDLPIESKLKAKTNNETEYPYG